MQNPTPPAAPDQDLFLTVLRAAAECGPRADPAVLLANVRCALEALFGSSLKATAALQSMEQCLRCLAMKLPVGATLFDAEALAHERANDIIAPLDAAHCQTALDAAGQAVAGHVVCPRLNCGATAHSLGVFSATFKGRFGDCKLRFARYQCQSEACGHRFAPARQHCGIAGRSRLLPGCADLVTYVAAALPHGKAAALLDKVVRFEISEHALQDACEDRGAAVIEVLLEEGERHRPHTEDGTPLPVERPAEATATAPKVAYVALDGVQALTRTKDEAKSVPAEPGQRGGKGACYDIKGAEIKNAVLWTDQDRVQESPTRGWHMQRHVVSLLENCWVFQPLLWLAMLRLRFDQAQVLVVLSDGAHWIRDLFLHLPLKVKPLMILDFYHVVLRIREVLRLVHGDGTDEYKRLSECWIGAIRMGEVQCVLRDLQDIPRKSKEVSDLVTYLTNNLDRMHYPEYEARGLQISSAPVESANFHVTGARIKQQGMRWTRKAAGEMAVLRADHANGHWERRTRQLIRRAA